MKLKTETKEAIAFWLAMALFFAGVSAFMESQFDRPARAAVPVQAAK